MGKKKKYEVPPITWLKVTDYMHAWLEDEYGCAIRVEDQKVLCIFDIPGAKDILRMETWEDLMDKMPVGNALSCTRKNCYSAGMDLNEACMEKEYGVTRDLMRLFVPIECPKRCLTEYGVLRPWTLDVCLGKEQASALQRLLRQTFWEAVEDFNEDYAERRGTTKYPAVEMIEEFCAATNTPEEHIDAIRREWQRRVKRAAGTAPGKG